MNRNEIAAKLNVKYSCYISGFRRKVDEMVITQRVVVIPQRRFGTTYLVPFSGYPEDGTDRLS